VRLRRKPKHLHDHGYAETIRSRDKTKPAVTRKALNNQATVVVGRQVLVAHPHRHG
jgi:hypothetical protein